MIPNYLNSQKGVATLIALIMIGMLTMIGLAALSSSEDEVAIAGNELQEMRAFYAAESGLAKATALLISEYDSTGSLPVVMPAGTLSVNNCIVTYNALDNGDNSYTINSIAINKLDNAKIQLSQTLENSSQPMFQHALFSRTTLEIDGSRTDSYNSDSGSYAATQFDDYGAIGANGTVNINSSAIIGGDASSATAGGISVTGGATILGDTTTAADSVMLDLVPDAEYVWAENSSNIPGGMSGSYSYNATTKAMEFNSLVLDDGVYFFSSLYGQHGASLSVAPGASVTIYVTGETYIEHGTQINAGGSTSNLMLFTKGPLVHIEDSAAFYGTIYGPNSYFYVEGEAHVYGSVYAGEVYLEGSSRFHYDRDLVNYSRGSSGPPKIVAWRQW